MDEACGLAFKDMNFDRQICILLLRFIIAIQTSPSPSSYASDLDVVSVWRFQVIARVYDLASKLVELISDWRAVMEHGLTSTALSQMDHADRGVCRAATHFVLKTARTKKLFDVVNVDKGVIPRIKSLIRRKEKYFVYV